MNSVAAAIYSKLTGATSVTSLLASATAVYEKQVPQDATYPVVVFGKASGTQAYSLPTRRWVDHIYDIKAITQCDPDSVDFAAAGAIDEAVDALIGTNGQLTISGRTLLYCRRVADIPGYPENESGNVFTHVGGRYRIWST